MAITCIRIARINATSLHSILRHGYLPCQSLQCQARVIIWPPFLLLCVLSVFGYPMAKLSRELRFLLFCHCSFFVLLSDCWVWNDVCFTRNSLLITLINLIIYTSLWRFQIVCTDIIEFPSGSFFWVWLHQHRCEFRTLSEDHLRSSHLISSWSWPIWSPLSSISSSALSSSQSHFFRNRLHAWHRSAL